jgi:hypothetical protein
MTELPNGSSAVVRTKNGNQAVPFCGYTENVLPYPMFTCSSPLMYSHFTAGSGKSILAYVIPKAIESRGLIFSISSAIIEDIKSMPKAGLASSAYFYFDFKDSSKRDIRSLLCSILSQLCDQSDHSWSILSQLYASHRNGANQPSEDALVKCLQSILNIRGQRLTYIVIDAVDECPTTPGIPSPREKVLDLLEDLVISHPDLRICVTSRPEQDIRTILEPLTSRCISLHDQAGQKADIADYVRYVVHSDLTMRRWRPEDKELVIHTLTERANGM